MDLGELLGYLVLMSWTAPITGIAMCHIGLLYEPPMSLLGYTTTF
jgi:hypothetical protein